MVENAQKVVVHKGAVPVFEENRNFMEGIRQNEQQNARERRADDNDIQLLAQIIRDLIKGIKIGDSKYEDYLARLIVIENVPIYDGNQAVNLKVAMKSLNCKLHMFNPQLLEDLSNKLPDSLPTLEVGTESLKKRMCYTRGFLKLADGNRE